jgi:hypothetical protein
MSGKKKQLQNLNLLCNLQQMEKSLENIKSMIIDFFEKAGTDYWKTTYEISSAIKTDAATVSNILTTSGDFVRSSYRLKAGEPLYTTRDIFRNKAPFMDKMIGAFKNRID